MTPNKRILVTGAAGFIGYHLAQRLCEIGFLVVGLDNLNDYYDVSLKKSRIQQLKPNLNFHFAYGDLTDQNNLYKLFENNDFYYVVNLAAQAGVRHSLSHPHEYVDSNLCGFLNILEACRRYKPAHLVYASSSSVYGGSTKLPFSVTDTACHPLSLYAATKRANELMAHAYSNLYKLPTTGLRFFTVYGPYGRPDMALFLFTKSIFEGIPIDVYNFGQMQRDFTYIDDIVEGIIGMLARTPNENEEWDGNHPNPASSFASYRIFNLGCGKPIPLLHFIEILEKKIGKKAIKNFLPMQDGDVSDTYSDNEASYREIKFRPTVDIEEGISKFVDWYRNYYGVKI